MKKAFPRADWKWARVCSVTGSLLLAAGLFMLIPLTQMLEVVEEPQMMVRETRLSLPPPELPPPPADDPPPPEPQSVMPNRPTEPPPIEVPPLDLAFSPGAGEAIAMGTKPAAFAFEAHRDAIAVVQSFFTFEDLNETPRLLSTPPFRYPPQLERRGVREGQVIVEIEIQPDGQARFLRFVSSTEPELEPVARRIIEGARFSPPIINGQPHTVRGHFPVVLKN